MEELINQAKCGDEKAFIELIDSIKIDLYKIARTRLIVNDDIEDAVQETMIEAFNSLKTLRNNNLFKKWIIKILINKCNKIYKKRKNNISYEELEAEKFVADNSTDNVISNLEFDSMLKSLNYDEKIAVVLYYLEDYTTKDIAKVLKVSENTIKSRLRRAKVKMKENYEREGK